MHELEKAYAYEEPTPRLETGAVLWIVRGAWWLIAEDGTIATDGPVPWPAPCPN